MTTSREDTALQLGSLEELLGALGRAPEQPLGPVDLEPGRRVGRYTVVSQLGKGGMGAVYRARDEMLGRDVALKVLLLGHGRASVDRFRREILALASVSHPNVVSVHDAGVDGALPYLVLDLVEGQTLRERLRAGPLGVPEATKLARELARGLAAAHSVGIVHRDLKPENVLLDAQGTAKLGDFGLAQLVEREDVPSLGLTEAGALLGTTHYMAPEQVRGEKMDARTDYFALGAVLYEVLTGRRAFEASSRAEVLTAVLRDPPPSAPALLSDEGARRLLGVAFRCLEKAPERRFQTSAELLEALETDTPSPAALPEAHATRYATSSGAHIAYQVVSPPGPPTLLAAAPFISNIEVMWESPQAAAWLRAYASFSHFIHYDRRGVGMSDPIAPECSFEERVEDLRAVLDAEKVERAFLFGISEGGPTCIGFAAKYPERTQGLILMDTFARLVATADYPYGMQPEHCAAVIDRWVGTWGTPKSLSVPLFVASRLRDPDFVRWGNRYERQCASPGTVRRLLLLQFAIDVRHLLPAVRCPTLVMHRVGDPAILVDHGRYLGRHIAGARYVELEGIDHSPWLGDTERPLALIKDFLLNVPPSPPAR